MKTVVWALLAAVLAGALGFYGGVTYQKSQAPSFAGRTGGGFGGSGGATGGGGFNRGAGGAGRLAGNIATGTVISQDSSSITVKTANGSSKTVFVSSQTQVSKQQELTPADIKVGDVIAAFGQSANGGIDARMVQIVPPGGSFRLGGFGGGPGQGGANSGGGSSSGQ